MTGSGVQSKCEDGRGLVAHYRKPLFYSFSRCNALSCEHMNNCAPRLNAGIFGRRGPREDLPMLPREDYVRSSLKTDLFYLRVMKEHSLFLKASFMPRNLALGETAGYFIRQFESLLQEAVQLCDGALPEKVLASGQYATANTLDAEKVTQYYTGILTDTSVTARELALRPAVTENALAGLEGSVNDINQRAMAAVTALISFKSKLFSDVVSCRLFMNIYPSTIHHMLREAAHYSGMLLKLQNRMEPPAERELIEKALLWNPLLAEHARFTEGLLDPSEAMLKQSAAALALELDAAVAQSALARDNPALLANATAASLGGARKAREFVASGLSGMLGCKLKSMILPLLADHMLRETNHYIYVLGSQ